MVRKFAEYCGMGEFTQLYLLPQKRVYTPTRNYAHPPCTRPGRGSQHFCFKIAPMPMYTPRYAGNTSTCTGTDNQYLLLSLFQVYDRFQNNARALVYAQEIEAAILYARGPIHGLLRYETAGSLQTSSQREARAENCITPS